MKLLSPLAIVAGLLATVVALNIDWPWMAAVSAFFTGGNVMAAALSAQGRLN